MLSRQTTPSSPVYSPNHTAHTSFQAIATSPSNSIFLSSDTGNGSTVNKVKDKYYQKRLETIKSFHQSVHNRSSNSINSSFPNTPVSNSSEVNIFQESQMVRSNLSFSPNTKNDDSASKMEDIQIPNSPTLTQKSLNRQHSSSPSLVPLVKKLTNAMKLTSFHRNARTNKESSNDTKSDSVDVERNHNNESSDSQQVNENSKGLKPKMSVLTSFLVSKSKPTRDLDTLMEIEADTSIHEVTLNSSTLKATSISDTTKPSNHLISDSKVSTNKEMYDEVRKVTDSLDYSYEIDKKSNTEAKINSESPLLIQQLKQQHQQQQTLYEQAIDVRRKSSGLDLQSSESLDLNHKKVLKNNFHSQKVSSLPVSKDVTPTSSNVTNTDSHSGFHKPRDPSSAFVKSPINESLSTPRKKLLHNYKPARVTLDLGEQESNELTTDSSNNRLRAKLLSNDPKNDVNVFCDVIDTNIPGIQNLLVLSQILPDSINSGFYSNGNSDDIKTEIPLQAVLSAQYDTSLTTGIFQLYVILPRIFDQNQISTFLNPLNVKAIEGWLTFQLLDIHEDPFPWLSNVWRLKQLNSK